MLRGGTRSSRVQVALLASKVYNRPTFAASHGLNGVVLSSHRLSDSFRPYFSPNSQPLPLDRLNHDVSFQPSISSSLRLANCIIVQLSGRLFFSLLVLPTVFRPRRTGLAPPHPPTPDGEGVNSDRPATA
ncbi:unnamed protein product [Protopolystoma xenopodis]|uniref:Uncharacterized protein n=1 Tax=Protopolystoma xenopodis TaxID=117903 RepID=A0A448WGV4_9PLAT|nr:unnamed protein product [Protopolystoma xenopodis]